MSTVTRFMRELGLVLRVLFSLLVCFALFCSFTVPVSTEIRLLLLLAAIGAVTVVAPIRLSARFRALGSLALFLFVIACTQRSNVDPTPPRSGGLVTLPGLIPSFASALVDERDIVLVGARVMPWIGGITRNEANGLVPLLVREYDELREREGGYSSPLFRSLVTRSSADSYQVISFNGSLNPLHRDGAVIFLHGFGGNFSLLCNLISRIVPPRISTFCPSLDINGLWGSERGAGIVRSLASELRSRGYRKLFLAGLSNGGVGATELAIRDDLRDELDGVILLFGAHPHIERVARPTLLIFGDEDERFPPGYFRWLLATPAAGRRFDSGQITVHAVHGDHFYLLREPSGIASLLNDWIAGRISAEGQEGRAVTSSFKK